MTKGCQAKSSTEFIQTVLVNRTGVQGSKTYKVCLQLNHSNSFQNVKLASISTWLTVFNKHYSFSLDYLHYVIVL